MSTVSLDEDPIVITGVAAICASGHTAPMAFTSVKAGITRIGDSSEMFIRDERKVRRSVKCGAVEGVTDGYRRFLRLYRLAVRAFSEAVAHARIDQAALDACLLYVSVPEPLRPGLDDRVEHELARRISQALGVADMSPRTMSVPAGHAGVFMALEQAKLAIESGQCERAIVGGVDSYLDEFTLEWLNDIGRLKTDENSKGFVPGEAAAFIVLERQSVAVARQAGCYARLDSVANAYEDDSYYTTTPCTGKGLTRAIRSTLDACREEPEVSLVLCDLNGERHRANEWGLAMSRCFQGDAMPGKLWHPADGLGDTGAASGALNLVLAALALARGNGGRQALVWGSSDDGERGAALLSSLASQPIEEEVPSWA